MRILCALCFSACYFPVSRQALQRLFCGSAQAMVVIWLLAAINKEACTLLRAWPLWSIPLSVYNLSRSKENGLEV